MGGKGEGTGNGVPPCPPPHLTFSGYISSHAWQYFVGLPSADFILYHFFFKKNIFREFRQSIKQLSYSLSELIWIQTVCKDYQRTTLVNKALM